MSAKGGVEGLAKFNPLLIVNIRADELEGIGRTGVFVLRLEDGAEVDGGLRGRLGLVQLVLLNDSPLGQQGVQVFNFDQVARELGATE